MRILGVTATPERGDGKGLNEIFNNSISSVTTSDLIQQGYLSPLICYAVAAIDLKQLKHSKGEYNMMEAAKQLNRRAITNEVISNWKDKAFGRKTIIFAATIKHAEEVCDAFNEAGIPSKAINKGLNRAKRRAIYDELREGIIQVVVNVFVLTEGFDEPSVSCVVLLRPSSQISTMIQMIGRGLRLHVSKIDCVILDFGESLRTHGMIDVEVNLEGRLKKSEGVAPTKTCQNINCGALNPASVRHCKVCGSEFPPPKVIELKDFTMERLDLMEHSEQCWIELVPNQLFGLVSDYVNGSQFEFFIQFHKKKWYGYSSLSSKPNTYLCRDSLSEMRETLEEEFKGKKVRLDKFKSWRQSKASIKQKNFLKKCKIKYPKLLDKVDVKNIRAGEATTYISYFMKRQNNSNFIVPKK